MRDIYLIDPFAYISPARMKFVKHRRVSFSIQSIITELNIDIRDNDE